MVSKSSTEHHIMCALVQQTVMMHWSSVGTLLLACSITCLRNSKNKRTIPKIQLFQRIQRNHNQLALLVSTPLVSQETITVKLAACGIRAGIVLVILVILFVILVMLFCHRGHPFVILVLFFAILVILANLNCHPGHFLYLREAFHFCYLDQVTFFLFYTPCLSR